MSQLDLIRNYFGIRNIIRLLQRLGTSSNKQPTPSTSSCHSLLRKEEADAFGVSLLSSISVLCLFVFLFSVLKPSKSKLPLPGNCISDVVSVHRNGSSMYEWMVRIHLERLESAGLTCLCLGYFLQHRLLFRAPRKLDGIRLLRNPLCRCAMLHLDAWYFIFEDFRFPAELNPTDSGSLEGH